MPRATNEPRRAASGALAEKLGDAPEVGAIAALAPIQGKELGGRLHLVDLSLIHISEPTRQAEISYAVFCLKKKKKKKHRKKKQKK